MTPTPLLDRREPVMVNPPRPTRQIVEGALIAAAVCLVFARGHLGAVLLWLIPAQLLAILAHESGHLTAGLLAGLTVRQFAAGPLVISRESGGVRVRFVWSRMFRGQVQASPASPANLRRKFLIFVAGGPVATTLFLGVLPFLPDHPFTSALWIANLIGALSWRPVYAGGSASDGKCIQLLRRPSPEGEVLAAMLYLLALDAQGVPPRDWDAAEVERLRQAGTTPLAASAAILMITRALCLDDPEELAATVERALALASRMTPDLRRICFDAAAWTQAFCRRNAGFAEAWMADAQAVKGAVSAPEWDASSRAAIALAKGNVSEARQLFERAIAGLDRRPGTSGSLSACRERFATALKALYCASVS